jgi:DNA mismatch repair ATPase MutS
MLRLKKLFIDKSTYEALSCIEEHCESKQPYESELIKTDVCQRIVYPQTAPETRCDIANHVFGDLEFFESFDRESGNTSTVIDSVHKGKTHGSFALTKHILSNPIYDVDTLESRKNIMTRLSEIEIDHELFEQLALNERDISWLFSDNNADIESLYDMVYLNFWFLGKLNTSEHVLTGYNIYRILASPIIGIVSPIAYFIMPYLVIRMKFKVQISFISYIKFLFQSYFTLGEAFGSPIMNRMKYVTFGFTMLFYFQSLFSSIEISKAVYKLSKMLTTRVQGVIRFIKACSSIVNNYWADDIARSFSIQVKDLPKSLSYFENIGDQAPFTVFSNFGKQLAIFKRLKKEHYRPIINRAYLLDALFGIAKNNREFVHPEYIRDGKTQLVLSGCGHPCLEKEHMVTNDIALGTPNNMILTGPNAGGKSTLIKSIMISVVLSQTLTIAIAHNCTLTPFYFINSQINIPDCKGKMSLFEAEMYRSKSNFDKISQMPSDARAIIAMDEIFNSTNPLEGICGAYAIAKKLAADDRVASIISTHYTYLTKLASDIPDKFARFKMNVLMDEHGHVVGFPYKLKKGISRQYIALELLEKNGFDTDIINEALSIKKKLLK